MIVLYRQITWSSSHQFHIHVHICTDLLRAPCRTACFPNKVGFQCVDNGKCLVIGNCKVNLILKMTGFVSHYMYVVHAPEIRYLLYEPQNGKFVNLFCFFFQENSIIHNSVCTNDVLQRLKSFNFQCEPMREESVTSF